MYEKYYLSTLNSDCHGTNIHVPTSIILLIAKLLCQAINCLATNNPSAHILKTSYDKMVEFLSV